MPLKGLPGGRACVKGGWGVGFPSAAEGTEGSLWSRPASCPGKQTRRSSSWATEEAPVPRRGLGVMGRVLWGSQCCPALTVAPRRNRESWPQWPRPCPEVSSRGSQPPAPGSPLCTAGPRFCAFCRGCRCSLRVRPKSREEGVSRSGEPHGWAPDPWSSGFVSVSP